MGHCIDALAVGAPPECYTARRPLTDKTRSGLFPTSSELPELPVLPGSWGNCKRMFESPVFPDGRPYPYKGTHDEKKSSPDPRGLCIIQHIIGQRAHQTTNSQLSASLIN